MRWRTLTELVFLHHWRTMPCRLVFGDGTRTEGSIGYLIPSDFKEGMIYDTPQ